MAIEIGANEIVSIATDILTHTVVIVHALAHLNMTHMLPSAVGLSKTGRRVTGTTIAQACLLHAVNVGRMIVLSALAAALLPITMDESAESVKLSVSDLTSAGPTLVSLVSVCWTMVTLAAALLQPDAGGRATRAQASVTARYVDYNSHSSD